MRITDGINYHEKLDFMIQECCLQAKEHPFESFVFIVDHPKTVEKLFFKYTNHLVNINILTFSSFLKQQLITQHLTQHHIITDTEFIYQLRKLFNQTKLLCFSNQQIYSLIQKFIPLLKSYNLTEINYQKKQVSLHPKLIDFITVYQQLNQNLDEFTHLNLESIFDNCQFTTEDKMNIYIEADHLYQQKRQSIIKRLSLHHDVTLMYTHSQDHRLFNMPYHHLCEHAQSIGSSTFLLDNLFLQAPKRCNEEVNYYTFISPTPHQEVKRVIYNIYQRIVDEKLHYHDFMIVYPDSSYIDLIINQLNVFHIPHHLPITKSCVYDYSYQLILKTIDTIDATTIKQFSEELDKLDIDTQYHQYLQSLLIYHDTMNQDEFKEFFQATYQVNHVVSMINKDYISLCSIEQAQSDHPQYIYLLGMNETILPHSIKDVELLLDEDINVLKENNIQTPLTTLELLGIHHNDILKVLSQEFLSMTFSYSTQTLSGETLLPSSLYKQLRTMFHLKQEPLSQMIPLDEYYQKGGELKDKDCLNSNIQDYLKTKNQPETLSFDILKNLYSPHLSVSQIETYNQCPFSYFIQYGLAIYPAYETKLMPNELGSLVHYVLSLGIDKDIIIEDIVDDYIRQDEALSTKIQSSSINLYFIEQLKKDLHITLQVVKRQVSLTQFKVFAKEEKITDTIRGMNFKGYVDRIDQYHNKISIIDYKSSNKDIDLNLAMQGFQIQMLLYLKMVTEKSQKDPAAVLYFNTKKRILSVNQKISDPINENDFYKQYRYGGYIIDDESHSTIQAIDPQMDKKSDIVNVTYVKSKNEYKGHILTPEQLQIVLQKIEDHIYNLYQNILSGHIQIMPKGSDQSAIHTIVNPCRYCSYHSVCSFDVFYNDYTLVKLDIDKILGGEENAV